MTKRRLLSSGKQKINTPQARDQWAIYIVNWLNQDPEKKRKIGYARIKPSVQKSLDEAQTHWYKFVKDGHGVIDTAYKETTGMRMPAWLYDQCAEILNKNIKLFDGIKETDSLDWANDFFVPGYRTVIWTWWHFDYPHESGWQPMISEKEVPLMRIILSGRLEKINAEAEAYKACHYNHEADSWKEKTNLRHYKALCAQSDKIRSDLNQHG